MIFGHAIFRGLGSFFMGGLAISGFISLIVAIISIFMFPRVTKLTVYPSIFGSIGLIIGMVIGLAHEPIYQYSAISLILASLIVIFEYIVPNKAFNRTQNR